MPGRKRGRLSSGHLDLVWAEFEGLARHRRGCHGFSFHGCAYVDILLNHPARSKKNLGKNCKDLGEGFCHWLLVAMDLHGNGCLLVVAGGRGRRSGQRLER